LAAHFPISTDTEVKGDYPNRGMQGVGRYDARRENPGRRQTWREKFSGWSLFCINFSTSQS